MLLFLRKILFPFAVLYGFITFVRNFLYEKGFFKSKKFDIPIIAVGNLSVGGTGKTPHIEYLIRLLSDNYKIATLSRGYKRNSKGFILADNQATAATLGDEPFQFYTKFKNIEVAVDADRQNGIQQLLSLPNPPEIILLDDAYQHRKVQASFYILLTAFDDLYVDDFMLPTGNLRESRAGASRANIVIITKCPKDLSEEKKEALKLDLKLKSYQELLFSTVVYDDFVYSDSKKLALQQTKIAPKLLLAGIAKPEPFFDYLFQKGDEKLRFSDHHNFSEKELETIKAKSKDKIIITTEKDFTRLDNSILKDNLFYLPIKSVFLRDGDTQIKKMIERYLNPNLNNN